MIKTNLLKYLILCFSLTIVPTYAQPVENTQIQLTLLGTKGGPSLPSTERLPQSSLLQIGQQHFLIDAGYGASLRLVHNGIPLTSISKIFITHLHSDHVADYPALLLNAWASGLKSPIRVYGPPGTEAMTQGVWQTFARDINLRISNEGKPDIRKLVEVSEVVKQGQILQEPGLSVSVLYVPHPPFPTGEALAYRFDINGKSIVFSGDTAYFPKLAEFAHGADVLVSEAVYVKDVARLAERIGNGSRLAEAIISHHTPIEQVGQIAEAAKVKKLVISHLVPITTPDEVWLRAAEKYYSGSIIIGRDNMKIVF